MFTGSTCITRRFARGQVLYMMLMVFPVLLAATLWVSDYVIAWNSEDWLQKAADGASLAGAAYLPTSTDAACQAAQAYAAANILGCSAISNGTVSCAGTPSFQASSPCPTGAWTSIGGTSAQVKADIAADDMSITVTINKPVELFFAPFLNTLIGGVSSHSSEESHLVQVAGTASLRTIQSAQGMLPFAIPYDCVNQTYYQNYSFSPSDLSGYTTCSGPAWDAISYSTEPLNDAVTLLNDVENGYSQPVAIGDAVYTDTSTSATLVAQDIQQEILLGMAIDPNGTALQHAFNNPRACTIPLIKRDQNTPFGQAYVYGYAKVWLGGVDVTGNITIDFIKEPTQKVTPVLPGVTQTTDVGVFKAVLAD